MLINEPVNLLNNNLNLPSMNSRIARNGFYTSLNNYYFRMMNALTERKAHLSALLARGELLPLIKHAGRFAGRTLSWHIETGLLKRVTNAGFGGYVRQFDQVKPSEYEVSLNKAEKLMSNDIRFSGNKKKLFDATLRVIHYCKFPTTKFLPVTPEFAVENQINKRSSSGFPLFIRKGLLLTELIQQAHSVFNKQMDFIWNWPMTRGFRLQLREANNLLSRKVRVMYPYPGLITLIEDCFIYPFVEHFINNNTFYIIGKNGKQISDQIKSFKGKGKLVGSDISSFDQNLQNEVIICAFYIIRSQLNLTPSQAYIFDCLVKYFCVSLMVSKSKGKPSYGFIKLHGIPSGSGFTNMIGTLAQAIIAEYCHPNLLKDSLICGDDNLFVLGTVKFDIFRNTFERVFNLPIDPVKTLFFSDWSNCYFLGFKWINGIRMISPLLAINQMLWHSNFMTDLDIYERELARSASVLLNGKNGSFYFRKIFPDVINSLDMGVNIRFYYLNSYAPPSKLEGVSGKFQNSSLTSESRKVESLLTHIQDGWAIR